MGRQYEIFTVGRLTLCSKRIGTDPLKSRFVKATDSKGQLYLPAIKLYRILGLDPEKLVYSKTRPSSCRNNEDTDDEERERPDEIDLELTNAQHEETLLDHKIGECINNKMSSLQLLSSLEVPKQPQPQDQQQQGVLIPDLITTPQESLSFGDASVSKARGNVDSLIDIDLNNSPTSSPGTLQQGMGSNSDDLILNDEKKDQLSKDPFHCLSEDNQNVEKREEPSRQTTTESQSPSSTFYYEEDNTRPYLV